MLNFPHYAQKIRKTGEKVKIWPFLAKILTLKSQLLATLMSYHHQNFTEPFQCHLLAWVNATRSLG